MDQLICASLSHTHYWYEVGKLQVPASMSLSGYFERKYYCINMKRGNYCPKINVKEDITINTGDHKLQQSSTVHYTANQTFRRKVPLTHGIL